MDVAGQDITAKVQQMMESQPGAEFAADARVMQSLKEKVCTVALDYRSAMKNHDTADEESKSFELPDGNIIKVNQQIRCGAPELLFGGADGSGPSVQKICKEAIDTCDLDFRQDLVKSVVVA